MPLTRLTLRCAAADVPHVEALLDAAGAAAVALADAADVPVLEPAPGETPLWPSVRVEALFARDTDLRVLAALLEHALPADADVAIETLADNDWQAAGHGTIPARRIGRGLWLTSADEPAPEPGARCVRLHKGLAFGTGEHPTTSLCLDWIGAALPPGSRVLDYGCGSGVLALAALAAGATAAWTVDDDPQALVACRRNAALNGCEARLWVGTPEALPAVAVDVVLANILARPLIERARFFAERLAAGGVVVLSGVLRAQRDALYAAYDPFFVDLTVAERDEWLRIVGRKR